MIDRERAWSFFPTLVGMERPSTRNEILSLALDF